MLPGQRQLERHMAVAVVAVMQKHVDGGMSFQKRGKEPDGVPQKKHVPAPQTDWNRPSPAPLPLGSSLVPCAMMRGSVGGRSTENNRPFSLCSIARRTKCAAEPVQDSRLHEDLRTMNPGKQIQQTTVNSEIVDMSEMGLTEFRHRRQRRNLSSRRKSPLLRSSFQKDSIFPGSTFHKEDNCGRYCSMVSMDRFLFFDADSPRFARGWKPFPSALPGKEAAPAFSRRRIRPGGTPPSRHACRIWHNWPGDSSPRGCPTEPGLSSKPPSRRISIGWWVCPKIRSSDAANGTRSSSSCESG